MYYKPLVIFILVLLGADAFQAFLIRELRTDVAVLEEKARELNTRIRSANEVAKEEAKNAQIENNQIYSVQIASDCPAAITWGLEQAKEFK